MAHVILDGLNASKNRIKLHVYHSQAMMLTNPFPLILNPPTPQY